VTDHLTPLSPTLSGGDEGPKLLNFLIFQEKSSRVLVPHTYNPSYSEGRDQENHGSKPAQANSSQDPIWKKPSQKRAVEWLKV
jgi:hypothetical protein